VKEQIQEPNLWADAKRAETLLKQQAELQNKIDLIANASEQLTYAKDLYQIAKEEQDEETITEAITELKILSENLSKKEFELMLDGDADANNCFLEVNAGAGGTESCDWALMLLRMYLRFCEKQNYKTEIIQEIEGDGAGIKSATIKISGSYAYGFLKLESGVHRLVRISPFDSGARRHTSFASIWVYPEVSDEITIEIAEKDLRIDTYRASGAGGQHVNKTDSAIRLTHLPTGIAVQCQNNRSQHRNKAEAMNMLKARLYELELRKKQEQANIENASKADNGWGSQIRSYVFHPYQMVKDLRSSYETSNITEFLDGGIMKAIEKNLSHIKT